MDSLIGIKGKDFVIIAADTFNAYSVLKMKVFPSISNLELRRQDMESRWRKNHGHRWWALWCYGLRGLHSEKPCISWVQKRRQAFNRRHCKFHPTWARLSHQKGPILMQLSLGRFWGRRAKTLLARLSRVIGRAEQGSTWVCWVLDQQCHGYSWD